MCVYFFFTPIYMSKYEFLNLEIREMCELHNVDYNEISNLYAKTDFDINSLNKIKNLKIRSIIYECKTLFGESLKTDLIDDLFKVIKTAHDSRELGYLVERKVINNIKELFVLKNGENWDFFNYKIAFIITKRLTFVYNSDLESDENGVIEMSVLLKQIYVDILSYCTTMSIFFKKDKRIKERHLKSYIFRILILLSEMHTSKNNSDARVVLELKRVGAKTIYFINSGFHSPLFFHFYARILLSPAKTISWKKIALNGGYHYLNKRRIIEPSIYTDYVNLVPEVIDFVERQNKIGYSIDKDMVEYQHERVMQKLKVDSETNEKWREYFYNNSAESDLNRTDFEALNLKKKKIKIKNTRFLKKINNESEIKKVNHRIEIISSRVKKKFNKSLEDLLKKLKLKKTYLNSLIEKNKIEWDPSSYNKYLQRDFSHVFIIKIYLEMVKFFKDYTDPLYFILYFDFRGRNYLSSLVSPTQGWPFRFIYYFSENKANDFPCTDAEIPLYFFDIQTYLSKISVIEKMVRVFTDDEKQSVLWVLLSIGSITIKKARQITMEQFINEGFDNYINRREVSDDLENSELHYYYLIIDDMGKVGKNRYVIKDTSGSIFQNASIILGVKEERKEDVLKILNIDGDIWHDPYAPLVDYICEMVDPAYREYFTRKTLKKVIMTRYYNAKTLTGYSYFMKEVKIEQAKNSKLFESLKREFLKVYKMLNNLEKSLLFENSNQDYDNFLHNSNISIINYETFNFSIIMFEHTCKRINIRVNNKRRTHTILELSKEVNKIKMKNSRIPNVFHGEDAHRAREVVLMFGEDCFSIHDAFGVSYKNVNKLVGVANKTFDINKKRSFYKSETRVEKVTYSPFIVL